MTRETKIGLLVGLAFIIVIGILLSDHLTSTTEPPQATLINAGNGVRQAISSPGGVGTAAPVTIVAPPVSPATPVATENELRPPTPAVQIVHIGGPSVAQQQPPVTKISDAVEPGPVATDKRTPVAPTITDTALSKVATENGETLVDASAKPKSADKSYTAQPGDSVSKIASKYLGSSSKANIDRFLTANPSLQGDPSKLLAGKSYTIPGAAKADDTTASNDPAPPAAAATGNDSDDVIKAAKPAGDTVYVYTVKPGDNLTKIARDQLGDMHAVASIQELNSDKLKGAKHDVVLVGMKLKLPGKPVAQAN